MSQCVAVCRSVLQCVAEKCDMPISHATEAAAIHVVAAVAMCCSVLQCVAVCCSVLQYVAEKYDVLCFSFNQELPRYRSFQQLQQRLSLAIQEGAEGFGEA